MSVFSSPFYLCSFSIPTILAECSKDCIVPCFTVNCLYLLFFFIIQLQQVSVVINTSVCKSQRTANYCSNLTSLKNECWRVAVNRDHESSFASPLPMIITFSPFELWDLLSSLHELQVGISVIPSSQFNSICIHIYCCNATNKYINYKDTDQFLLLSTFSHTCFHRCFQLLNIIM